MGRRPIHSSEATEVLWVADPYTADKLRRCYGSQTHTQQISYGGAMGRDPYTADKRSSAYYTEVLQIADPYTYHMP